MIRRRQVFYVPGYDPRGIAAYYRLFRSELRRHAEMHGFTATTGRIEDGPADAPWLRRWRATRATPAGSVETIVDFCGWDDLIRDEARLGLFALLWRAARGYGAMLASGLFLIVRRLKRRSVLFMLYPYGMVLAYLIAMLAAIVGGGIVGWWLLGPAGCVGGGLVGLAAAVWFYRFTKRLDAKWYVWHLVAHWDFLRRQGVRGVPELAERCRVVAGKIAAAIADSSVDEVVVVGHSHGCFITIGLVALALELSPEPGSAPGGIGLVCLGPALRATYGFGPTQRFREDFRVVFGSSRVAFYESSAAHDILSFRDVDASGLGIEMPDGGRQEALTIPIDFRESLAGKTFEALRFSFYRLHFQYLMASETGRGYDYFDLVFSVAPFLKSGLGENPPPGSVSPAAIPEMAATS